jgi:5'-3' exonuclease
MRVGMSLHILFASMRKAVRDFQGDHVVICMEGRSWRKDYYKPYKANRQVVANKRTQHEIDDDKLFFEAFNDAVKFFAERTNCSVLHCGQAEADDLIAVWTQTHPADEHVIISSDSDFYQLLAPNVRQFNGITNELITLEGVFNIAGKTPKPVIDKNTGKQKRFDPEYELFLKCVRGDTSDNIFSAYPGARLKGTKTKTGITEAFEDRHNGGYNYNNFMLQRWTDHEGQEHRVRDAYERNRTLVDLTKQPEEIRTKCTAVIREAVNKPRVSQVGIHLMKFCAKWNLQKMSENPGEFAEFLNRGIDRVTMVEA